MTAHTFVAAGIAALAVAGILEQTREIAPRHTGTGAIAGRVVRTDGAMPSPVGPRHWGQSAAGLTAARIVAFKKRLVERRARNHGFMRRL